MTALDPLGTQSGEAATRASVFLQLPMTGLLIPLCPTRANPLQNGSPEENRSRQRKGSELLDHKQAGWKADGSHSSTTLMAKSPEIRLAGIFKWREALLTLLLYHPTARFQPFRFFVLRLQYSALADCSSLYWNQRFNEGKITLSASSTTEGIFCTSRCKQTPFLTVFCKTCLSLSADEH